MLVHYHACSAVTHVLQPQYHLAQTAPQVCIFKKQGICPPNVPESKSNQAERDSDMISLPLRLPSKSRQRWPKS